MLPSRGALLSLLHAAAACRLTAVPRSHVVEEADNTAKGDGEWWWAGQRRRRMSAAVVGEARRVGRGRQVAASAAREA